MQGIYCVLYKAYAKTLYMRIKPFCLALLVGGKLTLVEI